MPRATRKRKLLNPCRSQLLFVEQPRNGPRHDCGPQLRGAINPRSFIAEQSRQSVPVHSWVTPQFTSLEGTTARCNGQRKTNQQLTLNRTAHSTQVRSTLCKHPTLLFTSNSVSPGPCKGLSKNSTGSGVGDSPETRRSQGQSDKPIPLGSRDETLKSFLNTSGDQVTLKHNAFTAGKQSATPNTSSILIPPQIQTPEIPAHEHAASSCVLSLRFFPNQPRTPPRTENVLVRDTPECDYGLRVMWRRRKKLMRLLTKRGQLLHTEVMISSQSSKGV